MSEVTSWKSIFKLLHWVVALCVALDILGLEDKPHIWAGYLALGFVFLRIAVGKFIKTPKPANRLAQNIYLLIWVIILALAVTGWMLGLDKYWGDSQLALLHTYLSHFLAGLILVHFAGLLRNALYERKSTWKGMLP